MESIYFHAAIVAALAVIQSVFGMGILVFGTPTLLLLGFDFATVLGLLLPASISISLIQVIAGRHIPLPRSDKINMLICAATIVIFLSLLIQLDVKAHVDIWIGITMLGAAALRYSRDLQDRLRRVLEAQQSFYIVAMGAVHGLTNMGGALLALYASSVHKNKYIVRSTIARYYLLFGSIQLCTLVLLRPSSLSWSGIIVAPVAALAYFSVGNALFERASTPLYERSVTAFITAFGVVVIAKTYI